MKEHPVLFGQAKSLIGILTEPSHIRRDQPQRAVILLNPGIVHRVGPGRIYVKIARAVAEAGLSVLRFDFSGIGDSAVRQDNLPFERSAVREAQEAMDFLQAEHGIEEFILMGGCSGAAISLDGALNDRRVASAVLINFPIAQDDDENQDSDLTLRRASHYYRNFALASAKSWQKLFSGKANYRYLLRVLCFEAKRRFTALRVAPCETPLLASFRHLAERGVHVTLIYSESDPNLEELRDRIGRQLQQLSRRGNIKLSIVARADHTFTTLHDQDRLLELIVARIQMMSPSVRRLSDTRRRSRSAEHIVCPEALTRQSSF